MALLVASWLALLAACVPVGAAILRWTSAQRVFDRPGDRIILAIWLGVLLLGSGLLAVSLVVALSPLAGAVVGFGAAAAALSRRAVRAEVEAYRARLDTARIVAFLALAVGVAAFTAQPVVWFDTGLYHASAIRWLSEFGAVEGVALVHDRLGFASSWFALAAPFNPDGLRDHAVVVMGGFALLVLGLHALIALWRALGRRARTSDWLLLAGAAVLIAGMAAVQKANVSASPDLPVAILGLLVGWAIFTVAESRSDGSSAPPASPGPDSIPLLLALGTMTVKLQAAPLVAMAGLLYLSRGERRIRRGLWLVGLGAIVVTPWVAYELVVTGCPAYPVPVCTDVGWSVGADGAREAAETVQTSARWHAEPPGSELGWVGPWLADDLGRGLGALAAFSVVALAGGLWIGSRAAPGSGTRHAASWVVIGGAAGLFLFFVRTEEIFMVLLASLSLIPLGARRPGAGWLLSLGLSGVALTLYAAPDPRFAFGYMAVLFARLAVFQGPRVWRRLRPYVDPPVHVPAPGLATLLFAGAAAGILGPFVRPTTPLSEGPELLVPDEARAPVAVSPRNGIPYRLPTRTARPADEVASGVPAGLCWAAELPCTISEQIGSAVVLREPGEGIAGGFTQSDGR